MHELDIPAFLKIPADERRAVWEANPPQPMPAIGRATRDDEAAAALRAQLEAERKLKATNRISKLKASKEDRAGKVWCMKSCTWVNPT